MTFTGTSPKPADYPPTFDASDPHASRHEQHRFKVNGRSFALDIDHGHKVGCCMLPPVPASIVWWENLTKPGADTINCGNTRICLMIENA